MKHPLTNSLAMDEEDNEKKKKKKRRNNLSNIHFFIRHCFRRCIHQL